MQVPVQRQQIPEYIPFTASPPAVYQVERAANSSNSSLVTGAVLYVLLAAIALTLVLLKGKRKQTE